jgi:hypothetical protein
VPDAQVVVCGVHDVETFTVIADDTLTLEKVPEVQGRQTRSAVSVAACA